MNNLLEGFINAIGAFFKSLSPEKPPALTAQMKSLGFHWVKTDDGWHEACDMCGGNCGQCGTSLGRGLPVSLSQVVKSSGMDRKPPYGLPRNHL